MKITGVYFIRNMFNHKIYIGSSKDVRKRLLEHYRLLKLNKHINRHLQSAFNLCGEECFAFRLLEECDNYIQREQYYMDKYKSYNDKFGYNLEKYANNAGHARSEATRLKISKSGKGKKHKQTALMKANIEDIRKNPRGTGGINKAKTHCLRGHPFDEENTIHKKGGGRICRICARNTANASYHRNKTLKIKTHCPNGHLYSEDNIYTGTKKGRRCLRCYLDAMERKNLARRVGE